MPDPNDAKRLLEALAVPIQPVERSSSYRTSLLGAALVMVFMSFAYVSILAGLFWLLLNMFFYLFSFGSFFGPGLFGLAFYGVLFIAVLSLFVSLLKPLFLDPDNDSVEFQLRPDKEPFLFQFVGKVCEAVGAPSPHSIHVDLQVNAGASFVSGVFDRRMRLLIGLPLVLGLDTRQLAGIVAHEFGHFSQSTGMRLTFLVRSIDEWFSTAALSEDGWDKKIEELTEHSNIVIRWMFIIVSLIVFVGRKILLLLVMVGHFFVASLLRQMEYDADRHEARLVGSQSFAMTARQMRILQLSQEQTFKDLERYHRTEQLPDNLPAMLVDNANNVDQEKFRELEQELLKMDTAWYDSHPSDRERIQNAAEERATGLFTIEKPARVLFSDINGLCKLVTMRSYHEIFGGKFDPRKVRKSDALIASQKIRRAEGKAALRFALEQFSNYDTFYLPRYHLGEATNSTTYHATTQQRRQQLLQMVTNHAKLRQQEEQIRDEMVSVTCARRLIEAGFDLSGAGAAFPVSTLQQAHQKSIDCRQRNANLKSKLTPYRQILGQRLIDALEFLRAEQILQGTGDDPKVVEEVNCILKIWQRIVSLRSAFETFFFEVRVTSLLIMAASQRLDDQVLRSIQASVSRVHASMAQFQSSTSDLTYPFEHGLGKVSVAHYLLPKLPSVQEIPDTMDAASDMDDNLEFLLKRCVARLGALAEKVEKVFGLEPLEPPPEVVNMKDD